MFSALLLIFSQGTISHRLNADDRDAEVSDSSINREVEGSLPYDPFDMVDPKTGKPVSADATIELPTGKNVSAGEYYSKLNEYQRFLNSKGKTLKTAKSPGIIMTTILNVEKLAEQSKKQESKNIDFDEAIMERINDPEILWDELSKGVKEGTKDQVKQLYLDLINSGASIPRIAPESPRARIVLDKKDELHSVLAKEWTLYHDDAAEGEKSRFGANAKATLKIGANLRRINGLADVEANVTVMTRNISLLKGTIKGERNLTAESEADANLSFLGKSVYSKQWKDKTILINTEKADSTKSMTLKEGTKFRFSVGPVPVSGEVGVIGRVGYDWTFGLEDSEGAAAAIGYIDTSGYLEIGPDIEIVSFGSSCELIVLNDTVSLEGRMGLKLDDNGSPVLTATAKATNTLTVLAGEVYAFVRAYVPTLSIPPFAEKEWSWQIFKWDGLKLGDLTSPKTLFSLTKVVDKNGYSLKGAPEKEDYQDVDIEKETDLAFTEILKDLESEGTKIADLTNESTGTFAAVRTDISNWLQTIRP